MLFKLLMPTLIMLFLTTTSLVAETVTFGQSKLDLVTTDGKRTTITVEMAVTPEQLSQGLMFRKTLAQGSGMLFDFGQSRPVSMWMKNTLIPLDMLFIERSGRIIHIEEYTVPGTLEPRGPSQPVLGVLELPAGSTRRQGIRPGDRVDHPMFSTPK
jgi:uncharacterized membrane protein (UPF0127 family)